MSINHKRFTNNKDSEWSLQQGLAACSQSASQQQTQIIIEILLLSHLMQEYPRLFRPSLSAEKVILTPRVAPIRKYSTRRGLSMGKMNLSSDSTASHRPVNSYSFIGRQNLTESKGLTGQGLNQQLRHSHHAQPRKFFEQNPPKLKRVQSIKISPQAICDPILYISSKQRLKETNKEKLSNRYEEKEEFEEMLVIRPAPTTYRKLAPEQTPKKCIKRQGLCGKTRSSFLEFFKARKRSIKVSRSPPEKLQCILQRFLQVRRSKLQTEPSF